MSGTITELRSNAGRGSLLGEDGRTYVFGRRDLRNTWFHELTEGAPVTFEPGQSLSASQVHLIRAGVPRV